MRFEDKERTRKNLSQTLNTLLFAEILHLNLPVSDIFIIITLTWYYELSCDLWHLEAGWEIYILKIVQ